MNRTLLVSMLALALGIAPAQALRADEAAKDQEKEKEKTKDAEAAAILVDVTLKGHIGEDPVPVGFDGAPVGENLKGLIDRIGKAKADKDVKGLVVRLRDVKVGW